jgi:two-component system cell cycle response regulator
MKFKLSGWKLNSVEQAPHECEDKHLQIPTIDELTWLVNYHGLPEMVESEIKRSERSGREFAILVCDLNGIEQINDRHDHLARDRALCHLAHIFRLSCRILDIAARYGDDKIAIILPESGAIAADTVEHRICERVSMNVEEPLLSVNVGAAVYPRDGYTLDALFQTALGALCVKKELAADTVTYSEFLPPLISKQKQFLLQQRSVSN